MNETLRTVLEENEWEMNRSCTRVAAWTAWGILATLLIGQTGCFYISPFWMLFYFLALELPFWAVIVYSRKKAYRGAEIKYLMLALGILLPVCMTLPTLFGLFLMPLPLFIACRYFSVRLVWCTFALVNLLMPFVIALHTIFGLRVLSLDQAGIEDFQRFMVGKYTWFDSWKDWMLYCTPSFMLGLTVYTLTAWRICRGHRLRLGRYADAMERKADLEQGLAISIAHALMGAENPKPKDVGEIREANQPDVKNWTRDELANCIARCKRRAAIDPDFAALLDRDPAAAVKELEK